MTAAQTIAEWTAGLTVGQIPEDVVEHAEAGRLFVATLLLLVTVVVGLLAMVAGVTLGRAA